MFGAERVRGAGSVQAVERVLMLGGGGSAYPRLELTQPARRVIVVVAMEPAVTRLARRWFFQDELKRLVGERLRRITADARGYLPRAVAEGLRYDAIISACCPGSGPVCSLATVEALCPVQVFLRPGGLYLTNVVSAGRGANIDFLCDAAATAAVVSTQVHVLPCEDAEFGGEAKYLLLATDGDLGFGGELPMPREFCGTVLTDYPV